MKTLHFFFFFCKRRDFDGHPTSGLGTVGPVGMSQPVLPEARAPTFQNAAEPASDREITAPVS